MKASFTNINIHSIAVAFPKEKFDLLSLASKYGQQSIERIIGNTGIKKIRVAGDNLCTSDLCVAAAEHLITNLEIDRASIDGLIFISETADYILPATSVTMQNRLGLTKEVVTFDINYGCSGYVYGLYQANLLLTAGGCQRVLLCVGDTPTKFVHQEDRATCMLFGDAGSATLIEKGKNASTFLLKTDGAGYNNIIIPAGGYRLPKNETTAIPFEYADGNIRSEEKLHMDGMGVLYFALKEVPRIIKELLAELNWSTEEVGVYALHQANKLILEQIRRQMKLPKEKLPFGAAEVGNTVGTSIPALLVTEYESLKNVLAKVIICGFGVGLSWGAASLDLSQTIFLEPVEI